MYVRYICNNEKVREGKDLIGTLFTVISSIVLNIERNKDELSVVLIPKKFKHNSTCVIVLCHLKAVNEQYTF